MQDGGQKLCNILQKDMLLHLPLLYIIISYYVNHIESPFLLVKSKQTTIFVG